MDFSSSAPRAVHKNIFCDACENLIVGVRYRCVHPSCDDYDLCETCEAAPIARHPASHPLLKIKVSGLLERSRGSRAEERHLCPQKTPMIIDAHTSFDDEPVRAFHPVRPSCEGVSTPSTLANAPTPARASTPVAVCVSFILDRIFFSLILSLRSPATSLSPPLPPRRQPHCGRRTIPSTSSRRNRR